MKSQKQIPKKIITPQIPVDINDGLLAISNKKKPLLPLIKSAATSAHSKKIMVADDDPAIVDVLTLMLETENYKVCASGNGNTIADVDEIKPDLILLDILMSGINGHDICKELKNKQSTKHIPIIMISANKNAVEIARGACADDFIAKPFDMNKLLRVVAKYTKSEI